MHKEARKGGAIWPEMHSLAWPDLFRPGAYRLEIISAYNLQSISAWAKRVWPRETRKCMHVRLLTFMGVTIGLQRKYLHRYLTANPGGDGGSKLLD